MSILLSISLAISLFIININVLSSSCLFSQFNLVGHMCEELVELNAALPVGVHVLQQVVHLVVRRKHSWLGVLRIAIFEIFVDCNSRIRIFEDCNPATTHQRIASDCQALRQTRIHFHECQTFCEGGKCVDGHGSSAKVSRYERVIWRVKVADLNTVVSISLVSGAKASVSSPPIALALALPEIFLLVFKHQTPNTFPHSFTQLNRATTVSSSSFVVGWPLDSTQLWRPTVLLKPCWSKLWNGPLGMY